MKLSIKPIFFVIAILCGLTLFILSASGEGQVWDCPCGRTGNTGNYCGECAHPAPWIETTDSPSATITPTSTPQPTTIPTPEPVPNTLDVGDSIVFGNYEQDNNLNNGKEGIEWIVLEVEDNRILLISKYTLDAKPYHNTLRNITWADCDLRVWLNNDFINEAFNESEQSAIIFGNIDNKKEEGNPQWKTKGGNDTKDKVFLLSYFEAEKYFTDTLSRRCASTSYSKEGAGLSDEYKTVYNEGSCGWWLRSPGGKQSFAAFVDCAGELLYSAGVNDKSGVRPAVWIDINQLK